MDEPDVADTVILPRPKPLVPPAAAARVAQADDAERDDVERDDIEGDTLLRDALLGDALLGDSTANGRVEPVSPGDTGTPDPPPLPRAGSAVYRVSVNGGAPVSLDVPAIVGRAPRAPRVLRGQEPRLVPVESPDRQVSGTHLELRQEGRSVVVVDLHSTNGTVVTMPGGDPVRMRSGDSLVAGPGAVVDLGDGNSIEILPVGRYTAEIEGMLR